MPGQALPAREALCENACKINPEDRFSFKILLHILCLEVSFLVCRVLASTLRFMFHQISSMDEFIDL